MVYFVLFPCWTLLKFYTSEQTVHLKLYKHVNKKRVLKFKITLWIYFNLSSFFVNLSELKQVIGLEELTDLLFIKEK